MRMRRHDKYDWLCMAYRTMQTKEAVTFYDFIGRKTSFRLILLDLIESGRVFER